MSIELRDVLPTTAGITGAARTGASAPHKQRFGSDLALFEVHDEKSRADLEISIEQVAELTAWAGEKVFDSGFLWTLYRGKEGYVYDFSTPVLGPSPYKRLLIDEPFSTARVLVNQQYVREGAGDCAFEYPLDELLVTQWLARGRGIEFHGCGLIDAEIGPCLFLGHSGAGKSTTARLWRNRPGVRILSDDRIIVRQHGNAIWMYGTPWHGEAGFALPAQGRISRVFFLEHGNENELTPISVHTAAGEMFARSFLPFHDRDSLNRSLEFLHNVSQLVRCYRFRFRPDESAVAALVKFRD